LAFFGWSLIISKVDAREFLVWSVIAIIPHAVLAIQQGNHAASHWNQVAWYFTPAYQKHAASPSSM
jgi:hypothetical protein